MTATRMEEADLATLFEEIPALDEAAMAEAGDRLDRLTKPPGSLGRLEELVVWLAGVTGRSDAAVDTPAIIVAAADHGVARHGISAYPPTVTAQMVANFLTGGAAISVLARSIGASLTVVDVGVGAPIPATDRDPASARLVSARIRPGTADMTAGRAMSRAEALAAIGVGVDVAAEVIAQGAQVVAVGEMGIGNTTAAAAIAAVLTGEPVEDVTGRGTGVADEALMLKKALIRKALKVNRLDADDPLGVLAAVGGLEIAALVGIIARAAASNVPGGPRRVHHRGRRPGGDSPLADDRAAPPGRPSIRRAGSRDPPPPSRAPPRARARSPARRGDRSRARGRSAVDGLPTPRRDGDVLVRGRVRAGRGCRRASPSGTVTEAGGDHVLFIRHAATAWTGARYCGRSDPPLSRSGRRAAERLARSLDALAPDVRIVSSPLRRALETAEPIARALGGPPEVDDRWREADFGEAEGLTFDELQARWPELASSLLAGRTDVDWPGGERHRDLAARVQSAWSDLTATAPGARHTIVVSHGGPLRVAVGLATGEPAAAFPALLPGSIARFVRSASGVWRPDRLPAGTLAS